MTPDDFWLSVLASLMAALFVPFFIDVWNKVVIPLWQNILYRGKKVNGHWKATAVYTQNGKQVTEKEFINVRQNGYSVNGEFTSIDECAVTIYEFKGEIVNSILTASYWKKSEDDSHDRGTIAMRVINDNFLEGSFTFYEGSTIFNGSYRWQK